jgi:hypothetical protein
MFARAPVALRTPKSKSFLLLFFKKEALSSVRCSIDIEQTAESFHAHAIPEDVEIGPGDTVQVHGVPYEIAFGEIFTGECRATLVRANVFQRAWTVFTSIFEIGELYEVGFSPASDALSMKG